MRKKIRRWLFHHGFELFIGAMTAGCVTLGICIVLYLMTL